MWLARSSAAQLTAGQWRSGIEPHFGGLAAASVTEAMIVDWRAIRLDQLCDDYLLAAETLTLFDIFEDALLADRIASNPVRSIVDRGSFV